MNGEIKNNENLYQCKECGLHYKNKEMAEKCEAWCKEHKNCNVEITKDAEENKNNNLDLTDKKHISNSSELEICKEKCEEYLNNWKRSAADFINYKKDEMERMGVLVQYSKEDMIEKVLPIFDSFYLSEKQLPADLEKLCPTPLIEWTKGFLQIKKQIDDFLKKEGIEEIETVGKSFNPEIMEAVGEEISDTQHPTPNTVVEELQKGYTMNGKVLRPAKVKVTK